MASLTHRILPDTKAKKADISLPVTAISIIVEASCYKALYRIGNFLIVEASFCSVDPELSQSRCRKVWAAASTDGSPARRTGVSGSRGGDSRRFLGVIYTCMYTLSLWAEDES